MNEGQTLTSDHRSRPGPPLPRCLAVLAAATLAVVAAAPCAAAAAPAPRAATRGLDQQVLFSPAGQDVYTCFRIPSVVRTARGILLAFAEGRRTTCGDATDIDLVLRRSTDGGRTWSPLQVVDRGAGETHGNPEPVVDTATGRVFLAATYNAAMPEGGSCATPCDRTVHLRHSDDHGATWHLGARDRFPISPYDGTFRRKPSELALAELADGTVYVAGREQDGTDLGARDAARSSDGGDSFAEPFTALPDLYAPGVEGSVLRLAGRAGDRLLLASPADPDRRRRMEIRSSSDGGRTWEGVDRGRVVSTDWAGYSDLVGISDDVTGLLYEGGTATSTDEIRFARFTDDWLSGPPAPYPHTPDVAPLAGPADLIGGTAPTKGRFGGGLAFDGVDDAVRLPFRDALPLGARDFTAALWVRTTAAGGQQPLLAMGGVGPHQAQVVVRADPAAGSVTGAIATRQGSAAVASAAVSVHAAYADGGWHHVALRRTGGRLTLAVDGTSASAADVPGTVSRTFFSGALDDVRVWDRALADDELAAVRGRGADVPAGLVLSLPMDTVRSAPAARPLPRPDRRGGGRHRARAGG